MNFVSENTAPVSDADLASAAKALGCKIQDIKAVDRVEAPAGAFIADGRPTLLYESHPFHVQTKGRYDCYPDLSTPSWVRNYGAAGAHQYDRLNKAILLDREAALKSASWGMFQIMGSNFAEAGYDSVDAFVEDMVTSAGYQLDAFVAFLQNTGADKFLDAEDWTDFARSYNGPGQVGVYAARIEAARLKIA